MYLYKIIILTVVLLKCCESKTIASDRMVEVFAWKQIGFDFNGVKYTKDTDVEKKLDAVNFRDELTEPEKFFIQYNNIPIGFEVYGDTLFVTVPRRRYGIPSTLNFLDLSSSSTLLKPYPDVESTKDLVSVYRPRVDVCGRLWMVDTGLLEVPGARKQIQPPAIVVYDLKTKSRILKYELKPTDLVNERTSGGLTSITLDVDPKNCQNAYAYINDLATEGLVVFSMSKRDSWRIDHPSFKHDENSLNFSVAGHVINWRDGMFGIALSGPARDGNRTAFYHPLVTTQEFAINTKYLKDKNSHFAEHATILGNRGPNTQSGSHAYHSASKTLFFANVAQDAILCWNTETGTLVPENIGVAAQDHEKLVYISDLKVIGDDVWVLVNQIPRFVFSTLNPSEDNFFVHRGNVYDMIRGTVCEQK